MALFHAFVSTYKKIGEFELHPVKTRVALLVKMRFAAVNKLTPTYLDGHLVLTAPHDDPAFYKIDNLNNRYFVHHFRINKKADLTMPLKKAMRAAYDVGERKHIQKGADCRLK